MRQLQSAEKLFHKCKVCTRRGRGRFQPVRWLLLAHTPSTETFQSRMLSLELAEPGGDRRKKWKKQIEENFLVSNDVTKIIKNTHTPRGSLTTLITRCQAWAWYLGHAFRNQEKRIRGDSMRYHKSLNLSKASFFLKR